jgi:hypothetical protein
MADDKLLQEIDRLEYENMRLKAEFRASSQVIWAVLKECGGSVDINYDSIRDAGVIGNIISSTHDDKTGIITIRAEHKKE